MEAEKNLFLRRRGEDSGLGKGLTLAVLNAPRLPFVPFRIERNNGNRTRVSGQRAYDVLAAGVALIGYQYARIGHQQSSCSGPPERNMKDA
ncbi:hypothetical protein N7499_003024 [Penicillium canescens]|uniref:uncharacterized protein n=1 Tax=Penicillium canescens TaxID=5083 RepID=UPI0026E02035|nr:uncharacterized protein N7446_011902 [Penicillium canescens]KAJ6003546.1 hypothetical protein N7522_006238 [Penicillium canescens]KAJ6047068.1 hypothetical protein N7446_011902 [Penicillium canescens]KAJ6059816.1 hypothetical protein N7444_003455 [Penicillium canescens]KAJ6093693.1 hypothetical protein N7499_003024 [Penicillium canescens]KAJ6174508.1 hypothetical protein N7485_005245 [Penicillium canescens]